MVKYNYVIKIHNSTSAPRTGIATKKEIESMAAYIQKCYRTTTVEVTMTPLDKK